MSLINQMLKDLEARRAAEPGHAEDPLEHLAYSGYSGAARRRRTPGVAALALGVGFGLSTAAAAMFWQLSVVDHGTRAAGAEAPVSVPAPVRAIGDAGRVADLAGPPAAEAPAAASSGQKAEPVSRLAVWSAPAERIVGAVSAERLASAPSASTREERLIAGSTSIVVPGSDPFASAGTPSESKRPAAAGSVSEPPRPVPVAADGADARADGASEVRKTPRALGPEQRAALAYQRGYDQLVHGDSEAAEPHLRRALELAPEHRPAREALVGVLLAGTRWTEARAVLADGVRQHPEDARMAGLYGRVLAEQGEIRLAVLELQRRPPPLATDPGYHALLAALQQQLGQHAAAADLYRQLVAVQPTAGPWWAGLAISLEAQGQPGPARAAFRRALSEGGLSEALAEYAHQRLAHHENQLG